MLYAYLDLASGSALIGAFAAGLSGVVVAVRVALAKLGFKRKKKESQGEPSPNEGQDPPDETTSPDEPAQ